MRFLIANLSFILLIGEMKLQQKISFADDIFLLGLQLCGQHCKSRLVCQFHGEDMAPTCIPILQNLVLGC